MKAGLEISRALKVVILVIAGAIFFGEDYRPSINKNVIADITPKILASSFGPLQFTDITQVEEPWEHKALELPSPFEEIELETMVNCALANRIWKAQDEIMNTWPIYQQVRGKLRDKLFSTLEPNMLSDDELIQMAGKLREKFWQKGGCLSKDSYQDAYNTRILLEYGHKRNPDNMTIIDRLVETIQAANKITKFDQKQDKFVANNRVRKILLELRTKQFKQLREQTNNGQSLNLEDFKCGCDLVFLQQGHDMQAAQKTVEWLRRNIWLCNLTGYYETLATTEMYLDKGFKTNMKIYYFPEEEYLDNCRYQWRLPSFHGPEKRNGIIKEEDTNGTQTNFAIENH